MSYAENLAKANKCINFKSIKGKDYAEVNQRILAFWSLFPEGQIITDKLSDDGTRCDFRARVYRTKDEERPCAVGHAYECKGGGVNATSYLENCETSAVGRALGMLGIGATHSIASAEEVLMAIEGQSKASSAIASTHGEEIPEYKEQEPEIARDYAELTVLKERLAAARGITPEEAGRDIVTRYGNPKDMTSQQFKRFIAGLTAEITGLERHE